MPWCEDCSKFWNPPELAAGETCPTCRRRLVGPAGGEGEVLGAATTGTRTLTRAKGAPWHFKLMIIGVTVYMIYRIYWLIEWLPKHI